MREENAGPGITAIVAALCLALVVVHVEGAKQEELVMQLSNGFNVMHMANTTEFQPVLHAPNGVFAFGFLCVDGTFLDLAVVHLPSSLPLWRATPSRVGNWSSPATLAFDGRLILTDPKAGVLWYTPNVVGDIAVLLNSSNLVIRRFEEPDPAWQSFDNPSDTLVLDQNFTISSLPLISKNRRFALQLMKTYIALYMEFYAGRTKPMYWQHAALEADPLNATQGPIYGRLDGRGFFGLYIEGRVRPVDVLTLDTFTENLTAFRRMTLDDDGNLRAYYWNSTSWIPDYKAIHEPCELPTSCGAYGICVPGETQCMCINNSTGAPCHAEESNDLCGRGGGYFDVVRRKRVSLAYKEHLPFQTFKTLGECEWTCETNCSCWGAIYNNASGYCYLLDYPVETVVYEADDRKLGYFKVREQLVKPKKPDMSRGVTAATVVVSLILLGLVVAGVYFGYQVWETKRRRRRTGDPKMEQELTPGPYKDLKSLGSSDNSFKG